MTKFATVGDNCIDRFLPPASQSLVGGNALNVAVQLARLGHAAHYFGAVGDDADGDRTRLALTSNGVAVTGLRVRNGGTAYTDLSITIDGDRVIEYEHFGACAGYRPTPDEIVVLSGMRHVHLGWLDDGGALRRQLVAAQVSVSQDISVNVGADHRRVDGLAIAFASAGADQHGGESLMARLLDDGAKLAVVTLGADGSIASDGTTIVRTTIKPVVVIDTTGAGDSFIAGFLSAHCQGLPLLSCLESGRDHAAIACTHLGGFPQIPVPIIAAKGAIRS